MIQKQFFSRDDLVQVIRRQLESDILSRDFDVGVIGDKSSVISTRTWADLAEVWSDLKKGKNVMLWCGGLRDSSGGGVCPARKQNIMQVLS